MQNDNIDDLEFDAGKSEESFKIEVDLYDTGDYSSMLVIPCNDTYIVVANDEHICTLTHSCQEVECWEQQDGLLDDELVERIGAAIQSVGGESF